MPRKYEVAIIDLNLVISERSPPIRFRSNLPAGAVELIGIVECIYIIFTLRIRYKIPSESN